MRKVTLIERSDDWLIDFVGEDNNRDWLNMPEAFEQMSYDMGEKYGAFLWCLTSGRRARTLFIDQVYDKILAIAKDIASEMNVVLELKQYDPQNDKW